MKMQLIMPFKFGLTIILLSLFSMAHAAEKESLPMDLIELLGELDDDNQAGFDQDSLDAAMHDTQKPATPSNVTPSKPQQKIEVGGQK